MKIDVNSSLNFPLIIHIEYCAVCNLEIDKNCFFLEDLGFIYGRNVVGMSQYVHRALDKIESTFHYCSNYSGHTVMLKAKILDMSCFEVKVSHNLFRQVHNPKSKKSKFIISFTQFL